MEDIKNGEILLPGEDAETRREARKISKGFWPVLRRALKQLPFARDVVAAYYCAMDPATPRRVRIILFGALAYFILPFDAVPDMFALIGFSDDIAVLAAAIAAIRTSITEEHYLKADTALDAEQAKS